MIEAIDLVKIFWKSCVLKVGQSKKKKKQEK